MEFDVEIKGNNSPLTKSDTASHNVIIGANSVMNIDVPENSNVAEVPGKIIN